MKLIERGTVLEGSNKHNIVTAFYFIVLHRPDLIFSYHYSWNFFLQNKVFINTQNYRTKFMFDKERLFCGVGY